MCVCVCVCVYMDVCVGVCVSWVAGRIIFGIFEAVPECLEDLPLSILARRPHKELCPREHARLEEMTKDVGKLGVRLQSRESDIQAQDMGLVNRL